MLVLLILKAYAITLKSIPETFAPPPAMISSTAIYDSQTNTLYSIGGDQSQNTKYISTIFSFDLTSKQWKKIIHQSEYAPQYIIKHGSYLRKDRKILNFGFWSEIFFYSLDVDEWTKTEAQGERMEALSSFGYTSFTYNDTEYIAIFGGVGKSGFSGDLFLMNVYSLEFRKMNNAGRYPFGRIYSSVEYYNESIYVFGYSYMAYVAGFEAGNELFRYDLNLEYWEVVEVFGDVPPMRFNHYSAVYKDEMFIFYGFCQETFTEYHDCYKFNFGNRTWHYLTTLGDYIIALGAKVQVDNMLYVLYGRDTGNVFNSILAFDLESELPTLTILSKNWLSPPSRINHCSFVVNQNMYIFGGSNGDMYDSEVLYNDMWAFDLDLKEWKYVNTLGELPSSRKQFGCTKTTGDVFAIFGGIGESGYLNDLYYFHEPQLYWYKVTSSSNPPSVRALSCLAFYNNNLYIIGGRDEKAAFNEIWTYNFATNHFSLSKSTITTEGFYSISDSKCWVDTYTDTTSLIVIGGNDFSLNPNSNIFKFDFTSDNDLKLSIIPEGNIYQQSVVASENAVIITKDFIIRIGGSLYSYVLLFDMLAYDRNSYGYYSILNQQFPFWGHSAVHYKDSIYIFGGAGAVGVYRSLIPNNNLYELNLKPDLDIGCSEGTYGDYCEPCPKGTYYDKGKCELCPAGRFNNVTASVSVEQCSPCPESTFNNKQGATYCLYCHYSDICPIGSVSSYKSKEIPRNSSVQPSSYKSKKGFVTSFVNNLWYTFGILCLFLCITCLLIRRIWNKIQIIDFFVDNHENKLYQPITYKKTSMGGLFSLAFMLACGITLISGFLDFFYNNITEIKTLIPVITLEDQIQSELVSVNVSFYLYGGDCIQNDKCNPLIEYLEEGLSYTSRKVACVQINNNCQVLSEYRNLKLTSKNSKVYVNMKEKLSYSSAISVNITSSSSIPNEISSVITSIQPYSSQTLFRGATPSIFYYKFTPSIFTSESNDWPSQETGFHVSVDQVPTSGSVSPRETLYLKLYNLVNIFIVESDTAMKTQRLENQSWFLFGGTLLGSVFGLMGTFAFVLGATERITDQVLVRFERNKKFKEKRIRSFKLKEEFGKFREQHDETKVRPFDSNGTVLTNNK